jgi:hypothetical protein
LMVLLVILLGRAIPISSMVQPDAITAPSETPAVQVTATPPPS